MKRASRRQFIKTTAAGTAVLGTLPGLAAEPSAESEREIPKHLPLPIRGIHGYPVRHSVTAGSRIDFCFSADWPFRVEICRLGTGVDDPDSDEVVFDAGGFRAQAQPVFPGSYVHIARRLRGPRRSLTLEAWVRPWTLERLQGVISQEDKDDSEGFALGIGKDGYVGFYLGDGVSPDDAVVHRTPPAQLKRGHWHHLVATFDGSTKRVYVDGTVQGAWPFSNALRPGNHPLRLGAMGERGATTRFLDGDLAQVALYGRALATAEIAERFQERGLKPASGRGVLGNWDFREERGERVPDRSASGRDGRIINHGTRMIGGPSFDPEVPRFQEYHPDQDPKRGHGLRLSSDDLYDCRWRPTFSWQVPRNARPGIHVSRARFGGIATPRQYDVTFLVRRAPGRPSPPLLVLCSTNTWRAYSGAPFGVWPDSLHAVIGTDGLPNSEGNPPAYCLYRRHAAGQGAYQVGLRMPWPVAGPYVLYGGPTRYSHLMRAERFLHSWLDQAGYRFDIAADDDLHREPGLLKGYRAVVLNGHSEYWSLPMLSGLEKYLRDGGNLIVLSGNSLFWRVSFDPDTAVMECRKVDAPGDQMLPRERGECWHSQDGLRGGLLRDCGHPGWRYTGLETLGWNNQSNPRNFGPYVATGANHFLFHQPHETGIQPGERFGQGPGGTLPLANGHEFDLRLSTLARLQEQPSPAGIAVPPDPAGIVALANGIIPWKEGGSAFDYFFRPIHPKSDQGGEMIYWERPEGGRVFNAGSIGSGWALSVDPKFQSLMRNVLAHFGIR